LSLFRHMSDDRIQWSGDSSRMQTQTHAEGEKKSKDRKREMERTLVLGRDCGLLGVDHRTAVAVL
jgi:hypothetical protein